MNEIYNEELLKQQKQQKQKEYIKLYNLKNKEKRKEYMRLYDLKNKEKIKEKKTCEHDNIKSVCKLCCGGSICKHNNRRSVCKLCCGGSICEHNNIRPICKLCCGGSICEHDKRKHECKFCNFNSWLTYLLNKGLKRMFKVSIIKKATKTINYLGCDIEYFIKFINNKMIDGMNWDKIHLDHIKPLKAFNLNNEEEFFKCCHYSNYQPLLIADNMKKSSHWDNNSNNFWSENIIYKEYDKLFMP